MTEYRLNSLRAWIQAGHCTGMGIAGIPRGWKLMLRDSHGMETIVMGFLGVEQNCHGIPVGM